MGHIQCNHLLDQLSVTAEELQSIAIPLQSDEIGISPDEKFNIGSALCARYIGRAVRHVEDRSLPVKQDYRLHWWKVMKDFANSASGQALIAQSPTSKEDMEEVASNLGVEGEAIAWFGPELVRLLTGETYPLQHILTNELLFRIYSADECSRTNQYIAEVIKTLSLKTKNLRILEIGAGTGATTRRILQVCSPRGEPFCKEYVYTDISSRFFKTAEIELETWKSSLHFERLNIEEDPAAQGFEAHAYDIIVTTNCLHATSSLSQTLKNVHKLLRVGGMLGLVELITLTPYFNMIFGAIEGWWAGVDDGRTESPLQSTDQWDKHLKKAGFSGVSLAAYDMPEPERHIALLLSTALEN
ncbi:S-adenosyl-L-methionine-dependent methyltransferase [Phaeosphaeriaceae sp. PMI808]|nr:S-adenosyl-L-methionine-dependent methyltransferase [Phaeosphaeriaceae sp. PMI808]